MDSKNEAGKRDVDLFRVGLLESDRLIRQSSLFILFLHHPMFAFFLIAVASGAYMVSRVSGQSDCDTATFQQQWQVVLQIVTYSGTSWACCGPSTATPECIQDGVTGGCDATHSGLIQCVKIGQAIGCGENSNPGCGVYSGPYGSYGVQIYQGSGLAPLNLTSVGEGVLLHWPQLGYDNSVALCCGTASCELVSIQLLLTFYCSTDEYMLKCGGDYLHGICSVWRNTELGEFLLVNADPGASTSASRCAPLPILFFPAHHSYLRS